MMDGYFLTNGHMRMGLGWIYQLIIFVMFFLIVWWVLKQNPKLIRIKQKQAVHQAPMQILKLRLAKGEIKKKEYEELKKEILN